MYVTTARPQPFCSASSAMMLCVISDEACNPALTACSGHASAIAQLLSKTKEEKLTKLPTRGCLEVTACSVDGSDCLFCRRLVERLVVSKLTALIPAATLVQSRTYAACQLCGRGKA